jgi:amino acid adenylation domain-containing protein
LNASANQLGHYLQELGVEADARVGLLLERSPALITTLLAVLKAGGAYLPLSPDHPPQRLGLMLEDADAKLLITERRLASRLPSMKARLLFLEDALQEAARRPSSSPESAATAENLAYVIYTSGSTGMPKGVMVTHRNVARLVKGSDYAELNAGETLLQLAPVSFDASTFEIWGALLNGARLAVFAPGIPSVAELCAGLRRYGVTTLWLTAGLFHQVVELQLEGLRGLRQLLAGGDVLSVWHVREALRGLEGVRLINGYGPTEGTTFTCCHVITDVGDTTATVPIGRPIANTRVYVLDEGLRLLPVGAAGELYVGGDGLARGYLNRPELTAERFVPAPFSTEPGARLYRTGDRVRWLEGGVLEFLGRTDTQVKVRGFRIELGEVEAALCNHSSVREAVVLLRENVNGDKRLVAYVVTEAERAVASTALRDFLKSKLPDYMVPSSYVVLGRLPLTPNGKVDRRALPEVDGEAAGVAREYVAPRAGTEQRVAAIWEQVLQRERIGARDNFFELGGHSLLATRVVSHVQRHFGVELSLRRLFDAPTVEALAREIESARAGGEGIGAAQPIRRAPREGRRLQPSSADD